MIETEDEGEEGTEVILTPSKNQYAAASEILNYEMRESGAKLMESQVGNLSLIRHR